MTIVFICV